MTSDERIEIAARLRKTRGIMAFVEALGIDPDSDWRWMYASRSVADSRRRISERLRYCSGFFCSDTFEGFYARLNRCLFGDNGWNRPDSDVFKRLADLMDPTCHIVLRYGDSDFTDEPHYVCSRCGREGIDIYERKDYTLEGIIDHANYCSYCGARVVDGQP